MGNMTGIIPTVDQIEALHRKLAPSDAAYDLIYTHCVIIEELGRHRLAVVFVGHHDHFLLEVHWHVIVRRQRQALAHDGLADAAYDLIYTHCVIIAQITRQLIHRRNALFMRRCTLPADAPERTGEPAPGAFAVPATDGVTTRRSLR